MKGSKLLPIIMLFLWACNSDKGYQISGIVTDKNVEYVYLEQRVDGAYIIVDSSFVSEGRFQITGAVEFPDIYYISNGSRDKKLLFLENADYLLSADTVSFVDAVVEGGKFQNEYNVFEENQKLIWNKLITIDQSIEGLGSNEEKELANATVDSLYRSYIDNQKNYINDHANSPVSVYFLSRTQYGMDAVELQSKLSLLDSTLNKLATYQWLVKRIETLENVAIGQIAPDFEQADADGTMIRFSDVYSQNKYTLVDFWASWCKPCRNENPNVVAAYQKFHDKGFMVFGVSLDRDKARWLKAVDDDQLTWQHVSDLAGWKNEAAAKYGVNSIPANFLVDQKGMILATGLNQEKLQEKISELLK